MPFCGTSLISGLGVHCLTQEEQALVVVGCEMGDLQQFTFDCCFLVGGTTSKNHEEQRPWARVRRLHAFVHFQLFSVNYRVLRAKKKVAMGLANL